jgi:hypothetical protein
MTHHAGGLMNRLQLPAKARLFMWAGTMNEIMVNKPLLLSP